MAECDDGAQGGECGGIGQALDQRPVEFDRLGRIVDDLLDRGVAGAEVVDGNAEALAAQHVDIAL
ncbi:hypothetical protein D3C80_2230760 [compost metagenome]